MSYRVSIDGNFAGAINFAMQQNYVPIIRNLIVRNETEEALPELDVRIRFEPDFAREYHYFIGEIPAGESVEISPVRIHLRTEYLFSLTEKLLGVVTVEVCRKEERLCFLEREIELQAADQWNGGLGMPELIAAFVTPNHPVIAKVIQHASEVLKNWTGNPSFTGYQSRNPNNVKLQMGAVYEALRQENIIYNNPPASFEKTGQRVRMAHAVLEQKQGTCLDLSLLYAACLEAVGIHPLLVFLQGHVFGGCWLEENTFPDCVVDDLSALEKRMAPGAEEMLLVECTLFTSGKNVDFDGALDCGRRHFQTPDKFRYVIDIRRSRGSGIRPIPMQLTEQDRMEQAETGTENSSPAYAAPAALDQSLMGRVKEGNPEGLTKQKLWERKLLDFSLRNTLLNFRLTKNAFQLMTADLCELEDRLSGGTDFQILEIPSEWTGTRRDFRIFEEETDLSLVRNIAAQEFKSNRLRTFLEPAELEVRLKGLYRSARMSMEENGANTLFLALGFLRWYESDVSEKARYAPLVLVPVDIVRSVRSRGYIIRSRQEEIRMNVTLLAFLQQDYGIVIGGLDPLPEDEQGVDLRLVFHTVRQAVMAQRRWNVEEAAYLGLFSFGQFVMWNDLRSRMEEIAQNKVVSSLIEGRMNWDVGEWRITPENLDAELSPADMAVPMSADSSQMAAIAAAAAGQSFVLHGPPGTGKSQTITNMIANALYQGKSVLFVAEKMAALNVVQKRLEGIGLAPFCLELHSNKTNKGTVLSRLEKTLEVGRIKAPEEYLRTAERIHGLRTELNAVIEALHQRREYGCSLYEAIERYERHKGLRGRIPFDKKTLSGADRGRIEKWEELIRQYKVAVEEIGVYAQHPLAGYEGLTYSLELREQLREELKEMLEKCIQALPHQEALFHWAGGIADKSRQTAEKLLTVAGAAVMPGGVLTRLLEAPNYAQAEERLRRLAEAGKAYNSRHALLEEQFEPAVFSYAAGQAALRWKQAEGKWFLSRALEQNRLVKELRLYARKPETVTKDRMPGFYEALGLLEAGKREIQETPPQLTELTAGLFFGVSTDWGALEAALDKTAALEAGCALFRDGDRKAVKEAVLRGEEGALTGHVRELTEFRKCLDAFLEKWHIEDVTGRGSSVTESVTGRTGSGRAGATTDTTGTAAAEMYDIAESGAGRTGNGSGMQAAGESTFTDSRALRETGRKEELWLETLCRTLERYAGHLEELRSKTLFNQADAALRENGLGTVSEAYKSGRVTGADIQDAFTGSLYYGLALGTIAGDRRLADFHGKQYGDEIARYRETLSLYQRLTVQELAARLSAQVPVSGGASAATSELGILKKAIRSNGRQLSLRKLFDQIPALLRKLCPCMLMSPISVAQYIDPSFPKFDLVIFDEASQLPTSEAVGTIARGENVVVVGDPKQLPPTNFFSSNRVDEENGEQEDLESLLDDCLAVSMPQESLKWHYRSRHESLIAYSNMKYYDNRLYTFPSPADLVSEVRLIRPEGFYDKGKTKQNKAEARAIVAEVLRRLKDETLRGDSIGVVAFSSAQQNLIDDMLFEEFRKHPELEEFDRNSREPVFIKNLENVQGDERDVILFSVGYGPDAEGNVSMNFGPLNREGGWRRLNVAITRARKSMIVYSVLRPEQIDLTRTRAEGLAGLKGFLEFAERGRSALAQRADTLVKKEDFLVQDIADAVRGLGYEVKCNIGCSAFKMDMGIVDPEDRERYLLGLLLDGENCREAATARDRFLLQPEVLEGLGWNVMRVWTLDWVDDPSRVLAHIRQGLENASRSREPEKKAVPQPPVCFEAFQQMEREEAQETAARAYESALVEPAGSPDDFYLPENRKKITRVVKTVLEKEAPVSRKLLLRKVLGAFGISRTGARVEGIFSAVLEKEEMTVTREEDREFYWKKEQNPDEYAIYRVGGDEDGRRSMDDVPSREIQNAALEVLREQGAMERPDLVRETAKKFGFSRLGNVIENVVGYGLQACLKQGLMQEMDNGKIAGILRNFKAAESEK